RPLRPGEVSLDDLEKAFRETDLDESELDAAFLSRAGLVEAPAPAPPAPYQADDALDGTVDHAGDASQRKNSIRVPVDTLEHLMTMVSELVLTRNQLLELSRRDANSQFKAPLQRLSHVTAELQEGVMKTRMQPIGTAWSRLPRLVRDLCEDLGKDIELVMEGAETEIDRQLLDLVRDPMLHMIRNAADHGIETPAERRSAGKPLRGRIRVSAAQEGGYITVAIVDDGRGLNLTRIREKAARLGLASTGEIARMSDLQVARYIFHPGFSTASEVTNISGRGVGMDVVRTNIERMGGSVDVKTTAGQGTTVDIRIPLTLAIAAALILECGGQRFALPQMAVVELVRPTGNAEARIEHIHSAPVLRLREKLLPLVRLSTALGMGGAVERDWSEAFIVICQVGTSRFGVVVDSVIQTEEIVVKPLSARLRHLGCYSGATIMGDGAVIMILDPNGLAKHIGALTEAHNDNRLDIEQADAGGIEKSSLLVFHAGEGGPKAVPLALVTRLEEIDVARIERADGRHVVQYRGRLMRLVSFDGEVRIRETGAQPVLVFSSGESVVGLLVDEIIDIIEEALE
ncbi:MAG: chemotaxis protein CheW, partial [Beijerinckiaceae bacterium]